jgi:ribosomal protein L7/L12
VLDDPGQRPIGICNLVRRFRFDGLTTRQVKKLADSAPLTILPRMGRTQAEAIKIELEAPGAQVRLVPAG